MSKIKFSNGTTYEINEGASLGRIEIPATLDGISGIVSTLTESGNLDSVQFLSGEQVTGNYEGMILQNPVCHIETIGDTVTVVVAIREKTDVEKRLEALEAGQEIQDGAIGELGEVVSEMAGGEA